MLESAIRISLNAAMNHYEVDGTDARFVEMMENCLNELKNTKKISLYVNKPSN